MNSSDEGIFTTFPIGPRTIPPRMGLFFAPLVANVLATKLGVHSMIAINTMDSYIENRKRFIPSFLDTLSWLPPDYYDIWHDDDRREHLLTHITLLHQRGFLVERNADILRSDDGRVEFLASAPVHPGARMYNLEAAGHVRSRTDQSTLRLVREPALVMAFPPELTLPCIVPYRRRRQEANLFERVANQNFLVSRRRQTGITYQGYNIDVDFAWLNYLSCLQAKHLVVVGSIHVMWHLIFAAALAECVEGSPRMISLIITPYVYESFRFTPYELVHSLAKVDKRRASLFMLATLAWSRERCQWNFPLYHAVAGASVDQVEDAWRVATATVQSVDDPYSYTSLRDMIYQASRPSLNALLHLS